MKDKITIGQTRLERCIAWGFPGVAICGISLLIAISIGNDFRSNTVVEVATFATSNLFFWLLYATIFQFLPQDALASWAKKRRGITSELSMSEQEEGAKEKQEGTGIAEQACNNAIAAYEGVIHNASIEPTMSTETDIHAIYEQRNRKHQAEMLQRRERILASVRDYILETMSPFVDMEAIRIIQEDVLAWAIDSEHTPMPVHVRNGWSTLDSRHFIWNIAARLRMTGSDYSVLCQGFFIKRMFPDVCKDAEVEYLSKNLTIKPDEGFVHIDRPSKDDWRFGFEKGKESEE